MVSDIGLMTILIVRNEMRCRHIGYSFRLTARVVVVVVVVVVIIEVAVVAAAEVVVAEVAPSHKQDRTYNGLCYTSRGALAGTRNSFESSRPKNFSDFSSHQSLVVKVARDHVAHSPTSSVTRFMMLDVL